MNNLNRGQVLSITIVILGVLVASTSQLTELFGPGVTKYIVSASTLCMSIMAGINTILQSPSSQIAAVKEMKTPEVQEMQVAAVQAMPGVEKITVNSQASAKLATMAVDPTNAKIQATPAAQAEVFATARAAG